MHRCCCGFTRGHPCSGATSLRWCSRPFSALLFLSWGERSVEAQRQLFWIAMPVAGRGFCNSFWIFFFLFVKEKTTSLEKVSATGFICDQKGCFFPLVCLQPGGLQPQSLGRRWLCLLAPGRYQAAGTWPCRSFPSPTPPAAVFVSRSPMSLLYFSPLDPGRYAWRSPARPWPRKSH